MMVPLATLLLYHPVSQLDTDTYEHPDTRRPLLGKMWFLSLLTTLSDWGAYSLLLSPCLRLYLDGSVGKYTSYTVHLHARTNPSPAPFFSLRLRDLCDNTEPVSQ